MRWFTFALNRVAELTRANEIISRWSVFALNVLALLRRAYRARTDLIRFCSKRVSFGLVQKWFIYSDDSLLHWTANPAGVRAKLAQLELIAFCTKSECDDTAAKWLSESTYLVNPVLFKTSGGFTVHSYNNTRGKAQHKYRSFRQRSAYATVAQR